VNNYNARGAVEVAADSAVGCKTWLARPLFLPNEFASLKNPPDFATIHFRSRRKQKLSVSRSRFTFALPIT
jgi:hypothetical protein